MNVELPDPANAPRLATVPQLAREMQVSEFSLRAWIRAGKVRAVKAGRVYRIPHAERCRLLGMPQ